MDQQKLRSLVFDKTGVKIDIDDPIFALVALNEAVLAEAVERHVALLDAATDTLAGQVAALRDGGVAATGPAPLARASTPAPAPASAPAHASAAAHAGGHAAAPSPSRYEQRSMLIAAGAAVLGALLVLCGQALLFRPAPAPAPQLVAKELTVAQTLALRDAERLTRAVQKLDPKVRAAIQADLQKP
jgi:hypothetical protein